MEKPWALPAEEVLKELGTPPEGLPPEEVQERLRRYGPNRLPSPPGRSPWRIFFSQFRSLFVYVLLVAALAAYFLGEPVDAAVILAVVILNALLGFYQEYRAERSLEALRTYLTPRALVRRAGKVQTVESTQIVPGDLLLLKAGAKVPADARLIEVRALQVDESVLTGESLPVEKSPEPLPEGTPLAERKNLVFSGTLVTAGEGLAVVVATGESTEFGRLARLMREVRLPRTPLTEKLEKFTRWVTLAILLLAGLTFALGRLRGFPLEESFMAAVALAVSAIPEGLPVIITVALAVGVSRMARRQAVVRYLPAVETLGSTTVIFTDKTGTLTENRLRPEVLVTAQGETHFLSQGEPSPDLREFLKAVALSLEEGLVLDEALAELLKTFGVSPPSFRILGKIPFDSTRKYQARLVETEGRRLLVLKGAPEIVLGLCSGAGELISRLEDLASQGLRLVALASGEVSAEDPFEALKEAPLRPLGLVGFRDPPRPEAPEAIRTALRAGIRVKMVTGDHPLTARRIGEEVGLSGEPVTGSLLETLSPEEVFARLEKTDLVARATPQTKLRLIEAFKARGEIVAMTGDGVNDAPALKAAHIGVAMGSGTEVAKEAADMVLLDDRFVTLVEAVREGRTVFDNLRKSLLFILPTNGGECLLLLAALVAASVLPVLPLHILWINLVTTVALAVTLSLEPPEPGVMDRPPRPPQAPLLDGRLLLQIVVVSALMAGLTWGAFDFWKSRHGVAEARALAVNLIVFLETFYLFNTRFLGQAPKNPLRLLSGNPLLRPGLLFILLAQLAFTYWKPLSGLFRVEGLHPEGWPVIFGAGILLFFLVEIEKRLFKIWLPSSKPQGEGHEVRHPER
ncbi:HAD-IC family P-type ATPase [Thermosulfurimonas marina]|uniref:HAD-IC family P-type ATPase n=1 Tax=Thermosulfurimonas marina TaxID=2047767 RepID=A0A6H1WSU3_9BACT|nr:HAD-IC family P-type ATPase [Thermosulfurimonas marina]QJA06241.1 HAD-IC family P-type ATPase [Thermosulfurimonas marina]